MEISTDIKENNLIIRLKGELDMHSVPVFKERVINIMDKNNLYNLIINLKNVQFIDSSGLGAILGRYRYLKDKHGQVKIVGLEPQIKRIFDLSGMLKLMPVYDTESEALTGQKVKGGK